MMPNPIDRPKRFDNYPVYTDSGSDIWGQAVNSE